MRPRSLWLLLPLVVAGACEMSERSRLPGGENALGDRGGSPPRDGPAGAGGMVAPPEATSLLGQPLFSVSLDPRTEERMLAQLDSAYAAYEADPDDADALIWLGRRLAYPGRYRDAIDAFGEGIDRHPADARFFRHRGHRYITVRELDRAIEDLEHAARLISGQKDEVEPDGQPNPAGIPTSTLHTNVWYHLGLARYVLGDFRGAVHAFRRGLELCRNDDMRVATADWLWMSYMRAGRVAEARELLGSIEAEMDLHENDAYHRRLLMYKRLIPPEALMPADAEPLTLATYGYGLGNWYLVHGDTIRARQIFEEVLATGFWPAFGFIAAEAEVARLGPRPWADTTP